MRFLFLILMLFASSVFCSAQITAETASGNERNDPIPQNLKETMAKQRIEYEKKEFDELKDRVREAVAIGAELKKTFISGKKMSSENLSRLKDMEKLFKKIRKDLGASGSPEIDGSVKFSTKKAAMERLFAELELFEAEIEKISRYAISVSAVDSSNRILTVIGFLRS